MGRGAALNPARRRWLAAGAAWPLAACAPEPAPVDGGWVGVASDRGHRLRQPPPALSGPARRAGVLVVGAGVAGLAAARALLAAGIDDLRVLDLEDAPGGNSRGHRVGGLACPLGAHYLPVPGPTTREVSQWLFELGLLRLEAGRTVADERHLCHSPQERLFFDGAWHDGLLPPAAPGSATLAQYRRFGQRVATLQREAGFSLPTRATPWRPLHAQLDGVTFAAWLDAEGFDDPLLRAHLDYACRDDYGAGLSTVSAWAGLHYFGSRHGFAVPGDEDGEREAVFTWPEGNAWLVQRLAQPLGERLLAGRSVLRVDAGRHEVQVLAWNETTGGVEAWTARAVVLAVPLFVARRLLAAPLPALDDALARQRHAPWLVANLLLDRPLQDRGIGPDMAWDNVLHGSAALGYVNATHQALAPATPARLLTAYWALPQQQRGALLSDHWRVWLARLVAELLPAHPDLPQRLQRAELMRYGHAMSIPVPGLRGAASLAALADPAAAGGRVVFAHADLAGYSVFEEAFTLGTLAGAALARRL